MTKIIVIDDDPTGNQTVHSCPLLTQWNPDLLKRGLEDPSPLMFILSNTRAMTAEDAAAVTREICENLKMVLDDRAEPYMIVSRSDSTLRGHFPLETDVIEEVFGRFDAMFLVPAFFEGGRITRDGVHYILTKDKMIRTDQTEFAHDSVFGYTTSYLPDYVEEKTGGRVATSDVHRMPICRTAQEYVERIRAIPANRWVAVDAEDYDGLRLFADAVRLLSADGRRYLFRSAASVLSALANLPPQPIPGESMGRLLRSNGPGVVVVGSHVSLTTNQLEQLLKNPAIEGIELDVTLLPEEATKLLERLHTRVLAAHQADRSAVVYTSRRERQFSTHEERLRFGAAVSDLLVRLVTELPESTSFLISKGGITSNDIVSKGLGLAMCQVIGQIIPGCTVVRTPESHRLGNLPVVIFPGNVGDAGSLDEVFNRLNQGRRSDA